MENNYSLNKSRHVLHSSYKLYKRKSHQLSENEKQSYEQMLLSLEKSIQQQDRAEASKLSNQLVEFNHTHFKRSALDYFREVSFAIILALIIAVVVRQMWFELYEIPTGSMRPTFKEQDHLTVSKLAFGINVPLETRHFYFDPSLVQRTSVVIFSGDNIALSDTDATYFGVIPYKKRYIKRMIGLPGDTLYFYGGELYGIDKDGHPIQDFHDNPWMKRIEHIPFLSFEGERTVVPGQDVKVFFKQMNQNLGRLTVSPYGETTGEIRLEKEWKLDSPSSVNDNKITTYSDFYGMRNFGMTRLLTKQQVQNIHPDTNLSEIGDSNLYLEIRHHPSLTYPQPQMMKTGYGFTIVLSPEVSFLSLEQKHLDAIMDNIYTARFVVSNGKAHRYSSGEGSIPFTGVPDGTYEFYYGKGYSIGWGGIAYELPKEHPLYAHTLENIQRLYNLGMEFSSYYNPQPHAVAFPHRYAYFKDKELYLLGAPIFKENDPILVAFNEREKKLEKESTKNRPYIRFQDYGAPLKDGQLDKEFIKTFGIKIPDQHYLVLGDNHAMSADSRVFGFVPEANLQGAPSLIIWPPGERWGLPNQKPYPIMNLPRAIVWSLIALIVIAWQVFRYWQLRRPIQLQRRK